MRKKIIYIMMVMLLFTGCEIGKNNQVSTVELQKNESKVNEQIKNKEKDENSGNKKNDQYEKIENEIDLSQFDLSGEDDSSGIMVMIGNYAKEFGFSFKKFRGIDTIATFIHNKSEEIEFEYSSKISEGNINVIFLDEDYNIIKKLGANKNKTFKLNLVKDKVYRIKIVGENAEDGKIIIKSVKHS